MQPFTVLTAIAMPLLRANVDTDAIIPSREMKTVSKSGLSSGLFAGWRYLEMGGRVPNPDFVMNDPVYARSQIILGGVNFGCGSSREHAVWALAEYGFRAVIAPSFAPIFQTNCITNGILPLELAAEDIARIASSVETDPEAQTLTIDLPKQIVRTADGAEYSFTIGAEAKEMLLEGLDPIDLTLKLRTQIEAMRAKGRTERPWAFL
ncbi:3-isopropylmalate dehydratase small subunit [Govanella unica]|uniref:3-isopropylmalate dehydratase small subunit n=1 Tax=Govanella unica TaxID=2975056 RepID=A0A9X3TW99_9PROT|nr:3-isopropylmalate dehydratase small subunit [Govania unica]MDA5192895.1 3-isopropylmalate dehydratase small subunit [Govania unica]